MNIPSSEKFLKAVAGADSAAMVRASEVRSILCEAEGEVEIWVRNQGVSGDVSHLTVTIPADGESAYMDALAKEIAFGGDVVIDLASFSTGTAVAIDLTA